MPQIDRRTFIAGSGAGLGLAGTLPAVARSSGGLAVLGLRVGQRDNPLGIDDARPSLSWRLEGHAGTVQSAYRIRAASSAKALASGRADLWDSGRVADDAMCVPYDGIPLASAQTCHWQVQVWDKRGRSASSVPAAWETGLLEPADWAGDWLAVEDSTERDDRLATPLWVIGSAPSPTVPRSFRLEFESAESTAVVTLAADGAIQRLHIDGRVLELPYHDPNGFGGAPAARFEIALKAGHHVLEADVAPVPGFFVKPVVILAAQLRIAAADGAMHRIADGWTTRLGQSGDWSKAEVAPVQPNFPWPPAPARLFRHAFTPPAAVRARLYVAALGGYRVWLNGTAVGSDELQTEPADYTRRIPYRTYDVTRLLRPGGNVVGALVGDGHFASYQAPDGRYAYQSAPRRFRLFLELVDADGTAQRFATGPEWRHAQSPLLMSEIYAGEDQDLQRWPDGWHDADFDDRRWELAWEAPEPKAPCMAALCEPVRIVRRMVPQTVRKIGDRLIVDFGQNFAGRVELRVKGSAGQKVTVRHAEILTADGGLDRRNLRAARAEDTYVLRGEAQGEVLCPMLTYQGFRYAEIEGAPLLDQAAIAGLVLSSAIDRNGTFRIEDQHVQKLWLNTLWSQQSNFMGIPTDCPQRDERLGWTGDAQVFWDTASFNMDTAAFTRSFCRLLREAQGGNGAFPLWAPSPSGLGWGSQSATPGWADAGVMLPYTAYLHSGDRQIVDENWQAMSAYLDGILATNPNGIWEQDRGADLGDWLSLDARSPMDETTPKALIATAMLARSIRQVAEMARWTGRDAEAGVWNDRLAQVRRAFRAAFVKPDGTVGNASQCSYILALRLDLLDSTERARAGSLLAADIRRRGKLLSTGFLGTPLALDALADSGERELAWDLLLRTGFPSWGYMVEHGATTIWERWNGDTGDVQMNSFNHYALGAVCGFLYRRVAGIAPTAPGFARFDVDPVVDARVASAGATVNTVRGRIETRWERRGAATLLSLEVPVGTIANVRLPSGTQEAAPGSHRFTL
jgi:alpha-L-rhamnosidase